MKTGNICISALMLSAVLTLTSCSGEAERSTVETVNASAVLSSGADTYNITEQGTYILTGEITDQTVTVDAGDSARVELIMDNAVISNSAGPAVYVRSADEVVITLKEGTASSLSDGSSYSMTDGQTTVDAAIFSKADLVITGTGSLNVTGNYKHAIVSKDDLTVLSGNLNVVAANVGINGKDSVVISDGDIRISAGSDGIRSDNDEDTSLGYVLLEGGSVDITAGNDGIQAETALTAVGGEVAIRSGSGSVNGLTSSEESYKGMKAGTEIVISGGTYLVDSQDDCIHSNGSVSISDGTLVLSGGDDGIHAETDLTMTGGSVVISKSYEGMEGSDIYISGGRISIVSADDGLNAAGGMDGSAMGGRFGQGMFGASTGSITISGGYLVIDASGDGIDSNGTLTVTDGIILISGPTNNGNGALDYDGSAAMSGGTLIALGSAGMTQSLSADSGVVSCVFEKQQGGSSFILCDEQGNVIASFTPAKEYESAIVAAPGLESGVNYTVIAGGTAENADENGFAQSGSYSGGEELAYVTVSGGAFAGMPGNMPGGKNGNKPGGMGGGKGGRQ